MTISDANRNTFDVAEFEKNRNLWTSKNIQSYRMIIGASGFLTNFPEEASLVVRDGRVESIKSLSKTGRNATDTYKSYDTVNELFAFIDSQRKAGAVRLMVEYDPGIGYPTQIEVDQDGFRGNDDELSVEVRNFEVIK